MTTPSTDMWNYLVGRHIVFGLSVCPSQSLSAQLLWNYWSDFDKTSHVARTSYVVVHIARKFWSSNFCGNYGRLNLEICLKSSWITLSAQLLWNYWSEFEETSYVARTSYVVVHITRKFWSSNFCRSYAHLNLENYLKNPHE